MKIQVVCVTLLGVGAALILASGQDASAKITDSAHDFSAAGWNSGGEICQPCHAPHNKSASNGAPLWNHALTTVTSYTPYTSDTYNGGAAWSGGAPSGISKLCLSCHDGTVALDSFGGVTGTTTMGAPALIGTNLSTHHPVGITYDSALVTADGGGLKTPPASLLFSGKIECASCHDVHSTGGFDKLLVMSNAASALCLTCHDK